MKSIPQVGQILTSVVKNLVAPGSQDCICGDLGDPWCPQHPRGLGLCSPSLSVDWDDIEALVGSPSFSIPDRQFPFGFEVAGL